jgi:hypothetical protein
VAGLGTGETGFTEDNKFVNIGNGAMLLLVLL